MTAKTPIGIHGQADIFLSLIHIFVLQQAVNARARELLIGYQTIGFKQAFDLAHPTSWFIPLGRQYGLLQCRGDLG